MEQTRPVAVEVKHAVYIDPPNDRRALPDFHFIKEVHHFEDGSTKPSIRFAYNYPMSFWVTKKAYRQTHKQKKESESIDRLVEYQATRSTLYRKIAEVLGMYNPGNVNPRKIHESPYLYGINTPSTALIKAEMTKKYPDTFARNTLAVLDLETDIINGDINKDTDTAILGSLTMGKRALLCYLKSWAAGNADFEDKIRACAQKHIGHILEQRQVSLEIVECETEIDIFKLLLERAHEWKPDFLVCWNILFDIKKIERRFIQAGLNPADYFSDPTVPLEYRHYNFVEGPKTKVTESGRTMALAAADRWHYVVCPASFYIIDAMCAYKRIRIGEAELPSYALDAILAKELTDVRKLKIESESFDSDLDWHKFMQQHRKVEYSVYNLFDSMCVELLDETTNDLGIKISIFAGSSDFADYRSEPRRTVDALFTYWRDEHREIIGTTGNKSEEELKADNEILSVKGWINTLSANRIRHTGLRILEDAPSIITYLYAHVADLDVSGAYPSNQEALNISRRTTVIEIVNHGCIPEQLGRMQGINLVCGQVNALEFTQFMFKAPTLDQLLEAFEHDEEERRSIQFTDRDGESEEFLDAA